MLAVCDADPKRFLCVHGVGHALQSTESVSSQGLNHALQFCSQTDSGDDVMNCSDGVVMEYFMNNFESGSYMVDDSEFGIYGGCDAVSHSQKVCYYWLPRWWIKQEYEPGDSVPNLYAMLAERCSAINETSLRESCIRGIGMSFHYVDILDTASMRTICQSISTNPAEQSICFNEALVLLEHKQSFFNVFR